MNTPVALLMGESIAVYLLVLCAHRFRARTGLGPFYALLGGLTAIMAWVTDAGLSVQSGSVTFVVGSTVFYTAVLLGAFVVYVFDGPRAARMAIMSIVVMSVLTPLVAAMIHAQFDMTAAAPVASVPVPDLRINTASVLTTLADLIFLGIAWEYLGQSSHRVRTWLRVYLTLLGVFVLDVLLFSTGAFGGTPAHLSIMTGTLASRLIVSAFAGPILFAYVHWQSTSGGRAIEHRPILAILVQMDEIQAELSSARREIARRKEAEERLADANAELKRLTERLHLAREQERSLVGWELHDEVGQTLSVVRMDLDELAKNCPPELADKARPTMQRTKALLDDAVLRLRRLYTDLRPGMLDDLGLSATIEWQAGEFTRRTGIDCQMVASEEVRTSSQDATVATYRVFQELLDNVAEHSGARRVEVRIQQRGDEVVVTVTDDGQGITETESRSPNSVGLAAIRERLRPYAGRLEIAGIRGKGTEARIIMPAGMPESEASQTAQ